MIKRYAIQTALFLFACLAFEATSLGQIKFVEESTDRGTRHIYKMTITPAKEPLPAFKHRFTVPLHKTISGNAITHYLRAFGEGGGTRAWKAAEAEVGVDEFGKYYGPPTGEKVDLEKLKRFSSSFDDFFQHISRATKCRDSDWGLGEEDLRGFETFELLLPSVQQMRSISRMLSLRIRLALQEKRFDDAVAQIRMGFQLGENISEMKILVTQLVAMAVSGITCNSVKEFIATPGSPNLYWALAELPKPLISIRNAVHLENSFPIRMFPILEQVLEEPNKNLDWDAELKKTTLAGMKARQAVFGKEPSEADAREFGGLTASEFSKAFSVASSLMQYTKAKKRLSRYQFSTEEIEAMPVAKVILLDIAFEVRRSSDEHHKFICLGVYKSDAMDELWDAEQRKGMALNMGSIITSIFSSSSAQVKNAEIRVTWQINALQNIEAIRMHAAQHGSLPKTLQEIKLHLPDNPYTKKPYEYRLRGDTAVLELPFTDGAYYAERFELTLAK